MNQIIHILKKDLRRYAWAWITIAILAAIEIYLHGTSAGMRESGLNSMLTMITSMVGGILFFIVTVMVVQEESLADPDANWLARPIARGKLLAEKLLFILLLIGIYTLSHAVVLSLNSGASRLPYALLGILPSLALWQAQVFLAAQTRSLPRYLLLAIGLTVGFYVSMFVLFYTLESFSDSFPSFDVGMLPAETPSHIVTIIQTLFWLLAGLGILSFLYLKRRILISWLFLIPACFVAAVLTPSDSTLGIDTYISFDNEISFELEKLRTNGTMYTNGSELTECLGIFEIDGDFTEKDIWVVVSGTTIQSGDKELELEQFARSQRVKVESDGRGSFSLGYIKKESIEGSGQEYTVTCSLQVTRSEQIEVGRLPLEVGADYSGSGNRIVIKSLWRNDNKLTVDFAGYIPSFAFEPSFIEAPYEALEGKFSFALNQIQNGMFYDFNLSNSWGDFGTISEANAETPLDDNASLDNYEVIVYARQIDASTWDYINGTGIAFE